MYGDCTKVRLADIKILYSTTGNSVIPRNRYHSARCELPSHNQHRGPEAIDYSTARRSTLHPGRVTHREGGVIKQHKSEKYSSGTEAVESASGTFEGVNDVECGDGLSDIPEAHMNNALGPLRARALTYWHARCT